jgi:hypothetical protein
MVHALLAVLAALAVIPGSESGGATRATAHAKVPRLDHVAVIVMENHEYGQVIGQRHARWITRQAHRFGLASRFYAISHPTLPNYLAVTGGSTFGTNSDCTTCHVNKPSIASELDQAGVSWRAYMEDMPKPCYKPTSVQDEHGRYAKHHNPFFYYDSIRAGPDCRKVVPYSRLRRDLSGNPPRFIWITPNLCHDMHDCSVAAGNRWLRRNVPDLVRGLGPKSAVFLTWDEGTSDRGCCRGAAHGGHVPTIVLGSAARQHAVTREHLDHYGLLRTVEEALRVPLLGHSAHARTLAALLR